MSVTGFQSREQLMKQLETARRRIAELERLVAELRGWRDAALYDLQLQRERD